MKQVEAVAVNMKKDLQVQNNSPSKN